MPLEFEHWNQDGIEILALKGRLVFGEEDLALRNEIGKAVTVGITCLVLDLGGLTDIDTTGLGTILFTLAKLRKAGGGLALARLHPSHMDLLVLAKMETVFKVFDNEQDAINSFFPERQVPRFDILEFLETWRRKSCASEGPGVVCRTPPAR